MTFPNAGPGERYSASLLRCTRSSHEIDRRTARNGSRFQTQAATKPHQLLMPHARMNADLVAARRVARLIARCASLIPVRKRYPRGRARIPRETPTSRPVR